MISDEVQARHYADLDQIRRYMEEIGLQARLLESSEEVPLNILSVGLDHSFPDRELILNFNFLPFLEEELDYIKLLQFYSIMPCEIKCNTDALKEFLLVVNGSLALGSFGLNNNNDVYLRYVLAAPKKKPINQDEIIEVVLIFNYTINIYGGLIMKLAEGELDLPSALDELRKI
jgi:hypothetical protein